MISSQILESIRIKIREEDVHICMYGELLR